MEWRSRSISRSQHRYVDYSTSSSLVERLDKESFKSENVENPREGDRGLSISVKCTLKIPQENSEALRVELSAELRQEDIFGNEVYKLVLSGVKKQAAVNRPWSTEGVSKKFSADGT